MRLLPRIHIQDADTVCPGLRDSVARFACAKVSKFSRDEDGALIIFGLFMFVLMMLACGMGLDMMRLETARVQLQSTVDRAALAAANLNQELPPQDVVADYFAKAGLTGFLDGVEVEENPGSRRVSIDTALNMPMHFMNLAGVNTLPAPAAGAAEESIGDVEISMVLDVSGSMGWYSRLTNLKGAAEDFVDVVYGTSTSGVVSTSIVPYSTQVNAGEDLLSNYTREDEHDISHCVNFESSSFDTTSLSTQTVLEQTQHFDPWYNSSNVSAPVCRSESGVDILAWSRDPQEIKDRVNGFAAGGNTSTDIGIKWGNALLDPGSQEVLTSMAAAGDVDSTLVGRPVEFDENDAMKVMVVMSDGVHTNQYFMKDAYRGDELTEVWASFNGQGQIIKYSIWSGNGPEPQESNGWDTDGQFYWPHAGQWKDRPHNHNHAERLTYQELWANVSILYHAYNHMLPVHGWDAVTEVLNMFDHVDPSVKNANMLDACTVAKDSGILIFSIGLEVTQASGQLLKDCATSPNPYHPSI